MRHDAYGALMACDRTGRWLRNRSTLDEDKSPPLTARKRPRQSDDGSETRSRNGEGGGGDGNGSVNGGDVSGCGGGARARDEGVEFRTPLPSRSSARKRSQQMMSKGEEVEPQTSGAAGRGKSARGDDSVKEQRGSERESGPAKLPVKAKAETTGATASDEMFSKADEGEGESRSRSKRRGRGTRRSAGLSEGGNAAGDAAASEESTVGISANAKLGTAAEGVGRNGMELSEVGETVTEGDTSAGDAIRDAEEVENASASTSAPAPASRRSKRARKDVEGSFSSSMTPNTDSIPGGADEGTCSIRTGEKVVPMDGASEEALEEALEEASEGASGEKDGEIKDDVDAKDSLEGRDKASNQSDLEGGVESNGDREEKDKEGAKKALEGNSTGKSCDGAGVGEEGHCPDNGELATEEADSKESGPTLQGKGKDSTSSGPGKCEPEGGTAESSSTEELPKQKPRLMPNVRSIGLSASTGPGVIGNALLRTPAWRERTRRARSPTTFYRPDIRTPSSSNSSGGSDRHSSGSSAKKSGHNNSCSGDNSGGSTNVSTTRRAGGDATSAGATGGDPSGNGDKKGGNSQGTGSSAGKGAGVNGDSKGSNHGKDGGNGSATSAAGTSSASASSNSGDVLSGKERREYRRAEAASRARELRVRCRKLMPTTRPLGVDRDGRVYLVFRGDARAVYVGASPSSLAAFEGVRGDAEGTDGSRGDVKPVLSAGTSSGGCAGSNLAIVDPNAEQEGGYWSVFRGPAVEELVRCRMRVLWKDSRIGCA